MVNDHDAEYRALLASLPVVGPNPNPSALHEEALAGSGAVFDNIYEANVIYVDFKATRLQKDLVEKQSAPAGWDTLDNVR